MAIRALSGGRRPQRHGRCWLRACHGASRHRGRDDWLAKRLSGAVSVRRRSRDPCNEQISSSAESLSEVLRGVGEVLRNPVVPGFVALMLVAYPSALSISRLWGGPSLHDTNRTINLDGKPDFWKDEINDPSSANDVLAPETAARILPFRELRLRCNSSSASVGSVGRRSASLRMCDQVYKCSNAGGSPSTRAAPSAGVGYACSLTCGAPTLFVTRKFQQHPSQPGRLPCYCKLKCAVPNGLHKPKTIIIGSDSIGHVFGAHHQTSAADSSE